MTFLKLVAMAYVFAAASAVCQPKPSDIGKEEYAVVSLALGRHTERVFVDGQTQSGSFSLRYYLSPHPSTQPKQETDPALIRPKREPTEDTKRFIRQETARRQDEEAFKSEISDETVTDWMEKNTESYAWENHFDLGAPTLLLTSNLNQELPQKSPDEVWKQLKARYPDLLAIEEASRVGFNHAGTQAVVLVGYHTGTIGGEGEYVLLEKKNGAWEIRHRLRAWLS